ncbi:putative NRPS-like protein biosynthetic cluster [Pestalotiopsis sp. IQ-011]
MWLNIVFYVGVIVCLNFACSPRAYYWDKTIESGKCLDVKAGTLALTVFNLISDTVVLLAPHRIIWGLKLPFNKRLGISFIFAMSILCVAIAAGRVVNAVQDLWVVDVTYALSTEGLTAHAEMTILFFVICASSIPKVAEDMGLCRLFDCRGSRISLNRQSQSKENIIHLESPSSRSPEEMSIDVEQGPDTRSGFVRTNF